MPDPHISSFANPRVKHAVRLRQRSFRDETGQMLIEGYRECKRALDHGYRPQILFCCEELYLKNLNEPEIVRRCREAGAEILSCSAPVFGKMAYRERPEGLLMIGPHLTRRLEDLRLPDPALIVVAEAVEKPGNLGTILRSADAAGVQAVIVCDRCTDIHNPNVVRASTGTLFSLPVIEADSGDTLAFLHARGFRILATTPHAEPLHTEVPLTGNVAIAVGSEQYGLTEKWMGAADLRVRIPMLGIADSLNVSAAATILLFEALRQRIAAGQARVPPHEAWHGEAMFDA
ncbi:MAG TPA: RNA methyltransferase [Kiritimatiellia bacterium]|jgi:TrmH family RNA methyltransferase|nr:RNA methyltransferase [Kiritimatiellia bacterium]HOM58442.1 RNA methyltransferase [Kiritimatiellia bacterium]HOR97597.1 RNA methyltransferase [Kiritimatiellia bacterium]HPC48559.1 RNA methyltransferase [Kiritimatiellia bacterium]HPK37756.1 RNA methyltransferase [Kiritimatiellia bacterium]